MRQYALTQSLCILCEKSASSLLLRPNCKIAIHVCGECNKQPVSEIISKMRDKYPEQPDHLENVCWIWLE